MRNIQPYLYWSCQGTKLQGACSGEPAPNFEWSYSFGNGFTGTDLLANELFVIPYYAGPPASVMAPALALVANAEGEAPVIAPNTWIEIKGASLAPAGDVRIWKAADFAGGQMPVSLDNVSVTIDGKPGFVYYISPTQINVLTPPDAITGMVPVVVKNNAAVSASFNVQAQPESPSFFVLNGGPYVAATHAGGALLGPPTLYPGSSTPAKPNETIVIYANGFGPTPVPVVSGSVTQSGTLSRTPVITIGSWTANVTFAGLISPGLYQFNIVVPLEATDGDQRITATFNGMSTQPGTLITIQR